MEKTNQFTLFELNEHVRRIIALNFTEGVWVSCELAQVNQSRGHWYISLVEKSEPENLFDAGDDKIVAQAEAVLWKSDFRRLERKLGVQVKSVLQAGMQVLLFVKVDFHERFGFKLLVQDIDPAFTIGSLVLKKEATIKMLQQKKLLEKNKLLSLPLVLQHIAVISSSRAAGFKDFEQQLIKNAYGYKIKYSLFEAAMQGENVRNDVGDAIEIINKNSANYDCVVLIRGGGAKLDLVAFDDAELCVSLASCKLPVITGIGHEIDESIADLVAFTSLKTPTAVADWIIQQNLNFEILLTEFEHQIEGLTKQFLQDESLKIERASQQIQLQAESILTQQNRLLDYVAEEVPRNTKRIIKLANKDLDHLERTLNLLDPDEILKRGFSITLKNGKVVSDVNQLKEKDEIETILSNGRIRSSIMKK